MPVVSAKDMTAPMTIGADTKMHPKVEPVAAAAPTTPAETATAKPQVDPRLIQLEKSRRQQARVLQAQRQKIMELESKLVPASSPQQLTTADIRAKFLQDPTSVGLSYEDLATVAMNAPTPEKQEINALKAEIDELRNGQTKALTAQEQAQKQARSNAVKQISREVASLVQTNDAYESIRSEKAQGAVVALIEMTYDEEGVLLKTEEALKEVEDYLVDEGFRKAQLKKVQERLNKKTTEQQSSQQQQPTKTMASQTPTATLTNALASTSTSLSPKDRKARAIAAFQGRLK